MAERADMQFRAKTGRMPSPVERSKLGTSVSPFDFSMYDKPGNLPMALRTGAPPSPPPPSPPLKKKPENTRAVGAGL